MVSVAMDNFKNTFIEGTTLKGTYRILENIKEGGMGKVYKAEHIELRYPVIIKLLKLGDNNNSEELKRRFNC